MWKQWKDSRLAEHHDAMVQRSSQKPGDSVLSKDGPRGGGMDRQFVFLCLEKHCNFTFLT